MFYWDYKGIIKVFFNKDNISINYYLYIYKKK